MSGQRALPSARAIAGAIGQEIRRARSAIGWTRTDLVERLDSDIHIQTVAGYEQGVRHCTVARLVEICRALGVPAPELLALALQRAEIDLETTELRVDLHAIVRDEQPELTALRAWAHHRLRDDAEGTGTVKLEPAAIEIMADFCQMSHSALLRHLSAFTPELTSRRA